MDQISEILCFNENLMQLIISEYFSAFCTTVFFHAGKSGAAFRHT